MAEEDYLRAVRAITGQGNVELTNGEVVSCRLLGCSIGPVRRRQNSDIGVIVRDGIGVSQVQRIDQAEDRILKKRLRPMSATELRHY